MQNTKLFMLVALVILTSSCKEKIQEEKDPAVEIPESFISFYEKFHSDTTYQVEHIIFPLEGMPALDPNSDLEGFSFWWERDGWKMHKPYNDMDGTFHRQYNNFAGIITETIVDNSGQFTMVRRFSESDGEWRLIYYKQMGR